MTRSIVYSPRARQQLTDLYRWIAAASGFPDRAEGYVSAIVDYCDGLASFPFVGVARDDLRPGIRTIGFRRRVVIAFAVTEESVEILGVYYGGRDYETLLRTDTD
ncbi:type II toxin-antitoxin system RelE/ParE family toxin [Ruania alba]|uniref:Plasmid stabilization system protein ParE n=1 Tax=Ruania alba TaxID=648782 RepID=A0A1H5LV42_9MICO|nr:type II toxin-antitoxin system RelE/ParE family toxin [Ruania alba]SEE80963.1 Plasmid stabilization system protein ParE [Ruania alba]